MAKAKIQGIHNNSIMGADFQRYSLGDTETFVVNSTNGFYTTKVEDLVIASTTYTAPSGSDIAGSMDVVFSGTPDLSEVLIGNYLDIQDCDDFANIGQHQITAVNDGTDTITVKIRGGVTNASSGGSAETMPFFGAYAATCLEDTSGLTINAADNSDGGSYGELVAGTVLSTEITEATIATSGSVELKII